MTEFVDANGQPLKGLALHNAKKKAEKLAAAQAATAEPAPAAQAAADAPQPPAETQLPPEQDFYADVLDALKAYGPPFSLQHKSETAQQYLARLLAAVLALDETKFPWSDEKDGFEKLLDGSNDWVRAATDALNNKQELPVLAGFSDKFSADAPAKAGRPKVEKPAKVKAEKPAKEPKTKKEKAPKAPRPEGFVKKIKRWVVQNPNGTLKDLTVAAADWVDAKGNKPAPATFSVIYSSAREVLDIVKEYGHWKD